MKQNVNPLEAEQKKCADRIYQLLKRNLPESKIEQILQQVKEEFKDSPSVSKLIDNKGRKEIHKVIENSRKHFKQELYRHAGLEVKQAIRTRGKVEKKAGFEKDIIRWFTEDVISGCTSWQIIHQLDQIMDVGYNPRYLADKIKDKAQIKKC